LGSAFPTNTNGPSITDPADGEVMAGFILLVAVAPEGFFQLFGQLGICI